MKLLILGGIFALNAVLCAMYPTVISGIFAGWTAGLFFCSCLEVRK